jgi:hypothetical protein
MRLQIGSYKSLIVTHISDQSSIQCESIQEIFTQANRNLLHLIFSRRKSASIGREMVMRKG